MASLSVTAQKVRFTDESNEWTLARIAFGDPGREVSFLVSAGYVGDTVISGLNYHKTRNEPLAIREDTVGERLYFRFITQIFQGAVTDTLEHVLFDYNLSVNDSFKVEFGSYRFILGVKSIDSIRMGAHFYRRWQMGAYDFIEALGTQQGPLFPAFPKIFEGGYQLRCFSSNGAQPPCSPAIPLPFAHMPVWAGIKMAAYFDNDSSCLVEPVTLDIGHVTAQQALPVLSPNPGGRNIKLWVPSGIPQSTLTIINPAGLQVIELPIDGGSEIPIGEYLSVPGIYYYILQDAANGQRYTGKFAFH